MKIRNTFLTQTSHDSADTKKKPASGLNKPNERGCYLFGLAEATPTPNEAVHHARERASFNRSSHTKLRKFYVPHSGENSDRGRPSHLSHVCRTHRGDVSEELWGYVRSRRKKKNRHRQTVELLTC